jgi:hypothetical protein
MMLKNCRPRILKWNFSSAVDDDWGLNESRGAACEFVAWQFLCHLNQHETIEFLLEELPQPPRHSTNLFEVERGDSQYPRTGELETSPLLSGSSAPISRPALRKQTVERGNNGERSDSAHQGLIDTTPYTRFFGLNALEIAAIAEAKRFLSQQVVQRVVNDIWNGEIVFWESLTVHSKKKPHIFNRK